jgi:hypothetical protein
MVRVPASWAGRMAGVAGAQPYRGLAARRTPIIPGHLYDKPVTVDLGNDGVAPQVTFPASGTVQVSIGPFVSGDAWSLDQCFVSTSTGQLDVSQALVYVGPLPLPQYAVTGTLSGGSSQFGLGGLGLTFGWFVWCAWTGGVTGAFAYLRVTGTKTVLTN